MNNICASCKQPTTSRETCGRGHKLCLYCFQTRGHDCVQCHMSSFRRCCSEYYCRCSRCHDLYCWRCSNYYYKCSGCNKAYCRRCANMIRCHRCQNYYCEECWDLDFGHCPRCDKN